MDLALYRKSRRKPIVGNAVSTGSYRLVYKGLLCVIFICTVILFWVTPRQAIVSIPLFYCTIGLLIVSLIFYFRAKRKESYLDFDTIFITICCLIGFSTTFFYNNGLLYKVLFLNFSFDESYVNKGNLLFLIGMQSYFIGSLSLVQIKENRKSKSQNRTINTQFLGIAILLLCMLFIISGGLSYYQSLYTNLGVAERGIFGYIQLLLPPFAVSAIATEFYNKCINPTYKINKVVVSSIVVMSAMLLYVGNRGGAIRLVMPIIGLYALLIKNVTFRQTLIFICIGILSMWLLQNFRARQDVVVNNEPVRIISDLTIPSRQTYVAMEYVDHYGYNYGQTMAAGVVGIIPLAQSFLENVMDISFDESANVLTDYTYKGSGAREQIGLGTTLIGDIYLSFGWPGVILLMFGLGRVVAKYTTRSLGLNYYAIIVMACLLATSVFYARVGYTNPVRMIVWALFIAYINKFIVFSFSNKL